MVTTVPDLDFAEADEELLYEDEEVEEEGIAGVLEPDEVEPEVEEMLTPLDDLSQTIFVQEEKPAKPAPKKKPGVVVVRPTTDESAAAEEEAKRKKRKGQPLVYNEELDRVVVDRKRKGGKHVDTWVDEDLDL
jgi:hypothetical protein